mmetsp:Transcript_66788/g.206803  ORF Transcript_66788/g.206803 Transcript_66788/m.206803 type:complete len:302 (-) Transcript_66788:12-917(-)
MRCPSSAASSLGSSGGSATVTTDSGGRAVSGGCMPSAASAALCAASAAAGITVCTLLRALWPPALPGGLRCRERRCSVARGLSWAGSPPALSLGLSPPGSAPGGEWSVTTPPPDGGILPAAVALGLWLPASTPWLGRGPAALGRVAWPGGPPAALPCELWCAGTGPPAVLPAPLPAMLPAMLPGRLATFAGGMGGDQGPVLGSVFGSAGMLAALGRVSCGCSGGSVPVRPPCSGGSAWREGARSGSCCCCKGGLPMDCAKAAQSPGFWRPSGSALCGSALKSGLQPLGKGPGPVVGSALLC